MRLAFKIMAAVMVVVAILLAGHSYLVFVREVELFRNDINLHAYLLGTVLASSVSDIWAKSGPEGVESIISDANRSEHLVRVRLVTMDGEAADSVSPMVAIGDLTPLRRGDEMLFPHYRYRGADYHVGYFPIATMTDHLMALELSQPLAPMREYVRTTVERKIVLFALFVVVCGLLVWWLGVHLVGRPMHAMVDQARSVGQGDLTARNDLEHITDEVGELAHGLNEMVENLRSAKVHLDEETAGRISALEQLNHAERLATVGKLASGLAHELGTPLNVISGRAKMIAGEKMPEAEVIDSAEVIGNQAERMTAIIRQLLDFARRKPLERQRMELSQPVNRVVNMLSPIAAQRKVTIEVKGDGHCPHVDMDVDQLQQVLSNLIVNAVHAMPDGGTINVRYGSKVVDPPADHGGGKSEHAYIEVSDTGEGIAEENLSRIFNPFFTTKQVGEGTGLGLSVADGIAKEHGGWLTAESVIDEGSTFTIYLPIGDSA